MSLSKREYLDALQQKHDVELSNAEKKIEEEIEKLQATLFDIKHEKRMVKAEINFHLKAGNSSEKCILDIPSVIWSEIRKYLQGHEFVLHNACLSSIDIEDAVTGGSARKKLRLIGEKVVAVLVMNFYLDNDDLSNFLQTTSPDLQMFAGINRWCLQQREDEDGNFSSVHQEVTFKHSVDISLFTNKAVKASNKWLLFRGQEFIFNSTEISTAAEYKLFWEAAVFFLEKFGPYLLCISVKLNNQFTMNVRIQNFCTNLLRVIPNLRKSRWHGGSEWTWINTKTIKRTVEPSLFIEGDYLRLQKMTWFESLRQNCVRWEIDSELKEIRQLHPKFWDSTKELLVFIEENSYMNLFRADFSNLRSINTIILRVIHVNGHVSHC